MTMLTEGSMIKALQRILARQIDMHYPDSDPNPNDDPYLDPNPNPNSNPTYMYVSMQHII